MPIKPENRARYPKDWAEIRQRILARAGNACEQCGVENHALGGRDRDGTWHPALPLGEKLLRLEWPKPGTEAWCGHDMGIIGGKRRIIGDRLRIIRIVLTIAHLDHTPENCEESNLRALCQRCHLKYDHEHHMQNAHETRRKRKAVGDLFGNAPA